MNNSNYSKNIIVTFGLISGLIAITISLIAYFLGKSVNPGALLSTLSFLLPVILIVIGIKKFKTQNKGFLKWAEAIKIGIGIALIWGLLALIFQYVLETYIDPSLIDDKIEVVRESLENWGMDDDVIEEELNKQKNKSPLFGISMGLLLFTFIGFVVSAITGAILKNTPEDNY